MFLLALRFANGQIDQSRISGTHAPRPMDQDHHIGFLMPDNIFVEKAEMRLVKENR